MNIDDTLSKMVHELGRLALSHPEAVEAIGRTVQHVIESPNPLETARRAVMATASNEGVELALQKILGRG